MQFKGYQVKSFLSKTKWNEYLETKRFVREAHELWRKNKCLQGFKTSLGSVVTAGNSYINSYRREIKRTNEKEYTLSFKANRIDFVVESTTLLGLIQAKRDKVRQHRQNLKRISSKVKRTYVQSINDYISHTLIGGVHTEPGTYLRHAETMRAKLVFKPKRPQTEEKHLGIELEFICNATREVLAVELQKAGVAKFVQLKHDGSINVDIQGYHAHELAICVPEILIEAMITKVTGVLKRFDAKVNKSTGMHVHLDVRQSTGRNFREVFARLVMAQGILYAMQPTSRKDNRYCKKTKTQNYATARDTGRYQGINPESVSRHSTIEVRIHSGTVDPIKVINWIKILIGIADCDTVEAKRAPRTVDTFCKAFKIGAELRAYIAARIKKFSVNGESEAA